jgi:predicted transcriptional regulator of viral defense system
MRIKASKKQQRLAALIREAGDTIRIDDAVKVFGLDRQKAAKLLAGWHNQGNLRRIARGLYVPVSPTALGRQQVLNDPWVLVPELYSPGYVGGWTALEYWELTEQLFRSVCVLTAKRTTFGDAKYQGVSFYIKHISKAQLFGTKTIWRDSVKVQVSDPHKTILDILNDPKLGAGLQHVMDVVTAYARQYGSKRDLEQLLSYADQIGNGALFKKLGYVAEKLDLETWFMDECHKRITKGYALLGTQDANNKLVTKWNLWVPKG